MDVEEMLGASDRFQAELADMLRDAFPGSSPSGLFFDRALTPEEILEVSDLQAAMTGASDA